jgi:hypothetical protein
VYLFIGAFSSAELRVRGRLTPRAELFTASILRRRVTAPQHLGALTGVGTRYAAGWFPPEADALPYPQHTYMLMHDAAQKANAQVWQ